MNAEIERRLRKLELREEQRTALIRRLQAQVRQLLNLLTQLGIL